MLILVVSTLLVAATGLLLSIRLADAGVTQWLVGAYVVAFSEIVLVSLLLSIGSNLRRTTLLASAGGLFCVALASAYRGRHLRLQNATRSLREALRSPTVAVTAVVALGVIGYSFALALFRPANDQDALEYHLARAAFWKQQEALGYIQGALDTRLSGFPPNSEIAMAFTMITSGTGRFAPLVQLIAALATALAVYGISQRIGLSTRAGLFGGLLFLTLPAVALQASTGLNDIVVTSFVASSAFFLLGKTPHNRLLAAIAIALMMGAKLTAILALPVLALIALVARPPRVFLTITTLAGAATIGAYWYWINLAKVGHVFGSNTAGRGISEQRVGVDPLAAIGRVIRLALDAIELPGAVGLDRLLYVGAAVLLVAVAFSTSGSIRERGGRAVLAAAATVAPLALVPIGHLLVRANQKLFFELRRTDIGYLDSDRSLTKASPIFSWYGPLGVLLAGLSCVLVVRAVRRRQLGAVALILSVAPAIWIVLIGVALPYAEWNGRYTMGGFALAAATWGVVLRLRPLAWAVAAVALLTTLLAFVHQHDRPSGVRLLEATTDGSVWSQPDWVVQATDHPELRTLIHFVDQNVPQHTRLALEPIRFPGSNSRGSLAPFPFFGPHLSRTVVLADSVSAAQGARADWAILRSGGSAGCVPGWRVVFRYDVWIVFRHVSGSRCA